MKEIRCPHCNTTFNVDDDAYESILKVVRNDEFHNELLKQTKMLQEKEEANKKLEISKIINENEKNLESYKIEIEKLKKEQELLETKFKNEKEIEINKLQNEIDNIKKEQEYKIDKAVSSKEKEIESLKSNLDLQKAKADLEISNLKEKSIEKEKYLQSQIEFYRDLKAKASTKMVGESLEQHCKDQFELSLRPALPNAYFEKDNKISETGSKGDFIFKDYSDGVEFISIMFEMKNENDTTSTKHKNEDFLKELDKDRNEKSCEYAVLVSTLEMDNDVYNAGIVDMSHRYPKMFVVRPQCFIPIINILRNASLNSLNLKKQLVEYKKENVDLEKLEDNIADFRTRFSKNYETAAKKFEDAIKDIDATITKLQKIKDELTSSSNQLRYANDKAEELSIKKLIKDSPSLQEQYKNIKK